ncbi:MAG: hypothetical protein R3263_09685, partial [Myxococcota bacterium]|nr:hypothetical protein [Myxococcota bacterium]
QEAAGEALPARIWERIDLLSGLRAGAMVVIGIPLVFFLSAPLAVSAGRLALSRAADARAMTRAFARVAGLQLVGGLLLAGSLLVA